MCCGHDIEDCCSEWFQSALAAANSTTTDESRLLFLQQRASRARRKRPCQLTKLARRESQDAYTYTVLHLRTTAMIKVVRRVRLLMNAPEWSYLKRRTTPAPSFKLFCTLVVEFGNCVRSQSASNARTAMWCFSVTFTPPPSFTAMLLAVVTA